MRVPGDYEVRFDCVDPSGNNAAHAIRAVKVVDTTCPKIELKGDTQIHVEASLKYVDPGWQAVDTLDGDISKSVTTDGDSVDTENSFVAKRSCREIQAYWTDAKTAEYFITTKQGANGWQRVKVWCDMAESGNAHTYLAVTNGTSVQDPYSSGGGKGSDCPLKGMQLLPFSSQAAKARARAHFGGVYFAGSTQSTDDYLCQLGPNDNGLDHLPAHNVAADLITHAQKGKFVVMYHVRDNAGNTECETKYRTVIVQDTLKPVISLHYQGGVVANGEPDPKHAQLAAAAQV